eukprot:9249008-Pyramimonas_sp.AAC.1
MFCGTSVPTYWASPGARILPPGRSQEAPGGPKRLLEAPGSPSRFQEAPGGTRVMRRDSLVLMRLIHTPIHSQFDS